LKEVPRIKELTLSSHQLTLYITKAANEREIVVVKNQVLKILKAIYNLSNLEVKDQLILAFDRR
jgi:hypothetical protein